MNISRSAVLGLIAGIGAAAGVALTLTGVASPASAQDWRGSAPVFQSDIERQQRLAEAQRAERSKAYGTTSYPKFMEGGAKPDIAPETPPIVYLDKSEPPGTIIVDTNGGTCITCCPASVPMPIRSRLGARVSSGQAPSASAASRHGHRGRRPGDAQAPAGLPITVSGGLINPLGAKAMYLGSSIYRIHGTNNARSIGRASSSGCFRLTNAHVTHLATLAKVGTAVRVVSSYSGVSTSAPLSSLFSGFGAGDDAPVKKVATKKKKK